MIPRKDKPMLWLVILIPLLSVIMGSITLFFAVTTGDPAVEQVEPPLSKTSWRDAP